ncbi:hypothetical protein D6C83_08584 [Aureobasidium pullulans]|uniref:Uncharacterized protein n=1 Tax=Aureobasidium pullulans TaxID=5580 RepID=A0A4S9ZVG5_AURPU|nr:hypothetical protein D6C83_08584 [Aureobasidium pullulans]
MFHEFAHAFCMAYVSSSDGIEPWIADNISNEIGYALEKYVLGGCPTPNVVIDHSSMNNEDHAQQKDHAPFGLSFAENWDLWRPESKLELRKSPINQDLTNVVYPLPQRPH